MRHRRPMVIGRVLFCLALAAAPTVLLVGCGSSQPETGTTSTAPPQIEEANKNMMNSMEAQKGAKK